MSSRIEDYALIGDCESAALVARNGSIDWLCLPRFDSPACFAALLGTNDNGRWQIAPREKNARIDRKYRQGTLILETIYRTGTGEAAVIDFMPPRDERPNVVRIVEGRRGEVPMALDLTLRFDYGSIVPWVRKTSEGISAIAGPDAVRLRADVPLRGQAQHTVAEFTVRRSERVCFSLTWHHSHENAPEPHDPEESLRETEQWWQDWSARSRYRGGWQEAVSRSLITLKALTSATTGGVVAAPTMSLPEQIGGVRNWDYRYCWLRDATFTLFALMHSGYVAEACAWREWLIRAVAGKPSELQLMYGIAGERRLTELELGWLSGYENSTPVRIGNGAWKQHQLDVYGEVMDAMHVAMKSGLDPSENAWRVQKAMMDFLESDWQEPDDGIWEVRGPRRQFTHSKVMAWVAADRAVKTVEQLGFDGPVERWRRLRGTIHEEVCRRAYDARQNSFVQSFDSDRLDASLLMMPLVGFLKPDDPRIKGTVEAIERGLTRDGFVERYSPDPDVDGLPHGEGTFLICSFWLADNLALQGRYDDAKNLFERLLALRNDVGLLSEEYDPETRRLLGNFPQAFSHIGLINTARNLSEHGGPAEQRPQS
ncbi:MAG: glycoside hydrolase family 15 protein [Planctomycetaceae bacterium]|nr:glycoside hydrolase family 15 protein [Planctomycetaceae bacterium]